MSFRDDYQDEMSPLSRLSDRDLDRLLAGRDPDDADLADLAPHLRAARAVLLEAPDEITEARHLAALTEAAREHAQRARPALPAEAPEPNVDWRRVMSRAKSFAFKLAAASVAGVLSLAGLAYAGVDLPGTAAEQAVERVSGIELPNQDTVETGRPEDAGKPDDAGRTDDAGRPSEPGKSVAEDVHAVIEGTDERGCEFGQAVADAASSNRQNDGGRPDNDPCAASDEAGTGESGAQGSRATGEENSAEGRARASTASGGASDAGADNAGTHDDAGRARADEASGGGREKGEAASDAGADNAGTQDDAGRAKAEDASSGGSAGGRRDRGKP